MKRPLFVLLILLCGCATTVVPNQRPINPVTVYIADYGIHSSLMLPLERGRYVEYAFGDWGYAAENHDWPHDAVGALLISFQSAFGRRYLAQLPPIAGPGVKGSAPHTLTPILASRADVQRLVDELDDRYSHGQGAARHNPENNIEYIKDSEHYSLAHNCNHLTAKSLKELGCHLYGWVGTSKFHVKGQAVAGLASAPAGSLSSARAD